MTRATVSWNKRWREQSLGRSSPFGLWKNKDSFSCWPFPRFPERDHLFRSWWKYHVHNDLTPSSSRFLFETQKFWLVNLPPQLIKCLFNIGFPHWGVGWPTIKNKDPINPHPPSSYSKPPDGWFWIASTRCAERGFMVADGVGLPTWRIIPGLGAVVRILRGTTRSLGDLLPVVINHLLNGMILQVGVAPKNNHHTLIFADSCDTNCFFCFWLFRRCLNRRVFVQNNTLGGWEWDDLNPKKVCFKREAFLLGNPESYL